MEFLRHHCKGDRRRHRYKGVWINVTRMLNRCNRRSREDESVDNIWLVGAGREADWFCFRKNNDNRIARPSEAGQSPLQHLSRYGCHIVGVTIPGRRLIVGVTILGRRLLMYSNVLVRKGRRRACSGEGPRAPEISRPSARRLSKRLRAGLCGVRARV